MQRSKYANARKFARVLTVLVALFATFVSSRQQVALAQDQRALAKDVVNDIEKLVAEEMTRLQIPGLSIAVAVDNDVRYSNGFGMSDVENNVPARSTTKYRTASIAKPMTSTLVLRLVEMGAIDLDKPVQTYCPAFPVKKWPVTTRQLLGHLGGVRHYKLPGEASGKKFFPSITAALPLFADDPLLHEPGTKFQYTTYGYNLLGAVAEGAMNARRDDATPKKTTFLELLDDHVLKPAGMRDTRSDHHFEMISNRSRGYFRATLKTRLLTHYGHGFKLGQLYNAEMHDTSMKIPGGGLVSTAEDLVRFASAVNSKRLLKAKSVRDAWTRQTLKDGTKTKYGLGWAIGELDGAPTIGHGGAQAGTATYLLLLPEQRIAVAAMCNLQGVSVGGLVQKVAKRIDASRSPTPKSLTSDSKEIQQLRELIAQEVKRNELPAFSIALVDGDRVVWSDGFGLANSEQDIPASSKTTYRVGSLSKLFTDIAVMQLVEQGKLDLDADIQKVLPDFQPQNATSTPITLRQLMSHQSGIVRESPVGSYFDPDEPSIEATVRSLNETSIVYAPNTRTKYSNAAVSVAGLALEKTVKQPFIPYIREQLLRPLGMKHADFVASKNVKSQLAEAWMWTVDGRRFKAPTFELGILPAGNLYCSVDDLARFMTVLFNDGKYDGGQLLSKKTLQEMLSPQGSSKSQFGIGFAISEFDGHKAIGHGGAVYGFSTQIKALPDQKLGVVAVTSLDGANGVVSRLSNHALRTLLAAKHGTPVPTYETSAPVPEEIARAIKGTFASDDSELTISELNGRVHLRQGSYRKEIRALADSLIVDDVMSFGPKIRMKSRDELVVNGSSFKRLENEKPKASPKKWDGLIGEYGWDHNTLYILEDRGQLYALIEWFYYYPLKELGDNEFAFPDYGLYHGEKLIFTRDKNGSASEVVAASVKFDRRNAGPAAGETFKITPVKPVESLRKPALAAQPPAENLTDRRESELVDVAKLDPTIKLDIRYASKNNFMGEVFYKQSRAFMQKPAAKAVVRVHRRLKQRGLGLLIHDAYRPWHVTKMFWDATPEKFKDFVANPRNGSRHNRGCAVDITLYDLKSGAPIQMVAGYDEFSPRAFPQYPGGTSLQRWYRDLLRDEMEKEGFTVYEYEWWHFDFKDWKRYPIQNLTFEQIEK
jgi:CubicO group peptidase (beta-lactamase class C family)/D-alanyl-D-alanine dipeptidase